MEKISWTDRVRNE